MKKRKRIVMILGLSLIGLGLIVFCPINFMLGSTQFEKSLLKLDKQAPEFHQGFQHVSWNGPTGSMSSGDVYTFRSKDWLWRFAIRHEN